VLGSGGTSGTGTIYSSLVVSATGTVTLPDSNTVTKAQAGLPSTYEVQPMRLDINTQQGTAFGSLKRISEIVVSLYNSANVSYGDSSSDLHSIDTTPNTLINKSTITGLFTGDVSVHQDGGFSVDDSIIISGSDPLPCTVRCLIPKVDVTGR